jgi:hypothetical protein
VLISIAPHLPVKLSTALSSFSKIGYRLSLSSYVSTKRNIQPSEMNRKPVFTTAAPPRIHRNGQHEPTVLNSDHPGITNRTTELSVGTCAIDVALIATYASSFLKIYVALNL